MLILQIEYPLLRVGTLDAQQDLKMPANDAENRAAWRKTVRQLVTLVQKSGVAYDESVGGYAFGRVIISGDGINPMHKDD